MKSYASTINLLSKGEIIAFPTDTIMGVAVDSNNERAVEKMFNLKSRDTNKQFICMIHDISILKNKIYIPEKIKPIIKNYWPGNLSVIFKYKNSQSTIGLRVPGCFELLQLLKEWGKPLAVTSANISGNEVCADIQAVEDIFGSKIKQYLKFDIKLSGEASTILDATSDNISVIRQGQLKLDI